MGKKSTNQNGKSFNFVFEHILNSPWKIVAELISVTTTPFVYLIAYIAGVKIGLNGKFYGMPIFLRSKGSELFIGRNFENRNIFWTNPLGINRRSMFCTWTPNSSIIIGDNVGMSGTVIVATDRVEIGNNTIIGPNTTIIDSDFHPVNPIGRRHSKENIKSKPVTIGKNVFIGMGVTILKGVTIGDNSIVGAGEIVSKPIDSNRVLFKGRITPLKIRSR